MGARKIEHPTDERGKRNYALRSDFVLRKLNNLLDDFQKFLGRLPRDIITYFIHGLIIIIPLAVTVWLLAWFFNLIDGMLAPFLGWALKRSIPGLGFATIITSIVLIGYLGFKIGEHRRAFNFLETSVMKIPIVGAIYGGTRQILNSFTTATTEKFIEVVFVEFPRRGLYSVGFVTSEVKDLDGNKFFTVFIPTAPTPAGGFLQIVPEADIIHSSITINDAMKMIISMGRVSRKDIADMLAGFPVTQAENKDNTD